jgi:hypothetical protein
MFKDGQTHVLSEEQSGWPAFYSDDLVQSVGKKICEKISNFPVNFHKFHALFSTRLAQVG